MTTTQLLAKWTLRAQQLAELTNKALAGVSKGGSYSFYRQAQLETDAADAKVKHYTKRLQTEQV
jgi:hypothetical protein